MLIRREHDRAVAIGQLSHAWVSGQLARAWGNERVAPPDPREEIALGAEQHDIGWARHDAAPAFNARTGLPRSFLETTVAQHLSVWRRAPESLSSQSMHAVLVVSMHGSALSQLRARRGERGLPALREHIRAEQRRQRRLRGLLGVSAEEAERTQRQMWTWDALSLALCLGWRPFTVRDVPRTDRGLLDLELRDTGSRRATIEPWPFGCAQLQLRCEARTLRRSYRDAGAMRRAFERARPEALTFTLARP